MIFVVYLECALSDLNTLRIQIFSYLNSPQYKRFMINNTFNTLIEIVIEIELLIPNGIHAFSLCRLTDFVAHLYYTVCVHVAYFCYVYLVRVIGRGDLPLALLLLFLS